MSYDIAIVNPSGAPLRYISITYDQHSRLIAAAERLRLPLIQRMSDFYADAKYYSTEMSALNRELAEIRDSMMGEQQILPVWLKETLALADEAMSNGLMIIGIAD